MRGGSKNIYPESGNHYNVSIMDRNERRSIIMALCWLLVVEASLERSKGSVPRWYRLFNVVRTWLNCTQIRTMELFKEPTLLEQKRRGRGGGLTLVTDGKMMFHNKALQQSWKWNLWTDCQSVIFYNMLYQQKKIALMKHRGQQPKTSAQLVFLRVHKNTRLYKV